MMQMNPLLSPPSLLEDEVEIPEEEFEPEDVLATWNISEAIEDEMLEVEAHG